LKKKIFGLQSSLKNKTNMHDELQHEVTQILHEWSDGNGEAPARLMPFVYDELRRQARNYLAKERGSHTLQPTALVHEAYLRLIDQTRVNWQNRAHFFGMAANMMRRVLVDHARAHAAEKRGGAVVRLSIEDVQIPLKQRAASLIALDEALVELAKFDERKARIVEMRFFGGLSDEEIAEVLGVSTRTVLRDWKTARLWLFRELSVSAE
jgi:RNA polymerase sigma factor (TIGR02999 family)